jgi:type II secretory pathway component PulF
VETYGSIKLAKGFEEPTRFKQVTEYLVAVTIVFYLIVGVYRVYVLPTFMRGLEDLGLSIPA